MIYIILRLFSQYNQVCTSHGRQQLPSAAPTTNTLRRQMESPASGDQLLLWQREPSFISNDRAPLPKNLAPSVPPRWRLGFPALRYLLPTSCLLATLHAFAEACCTLPLPRCRGRCCMLTPSTTTFFPAVAVEAVFGRGRSLSILP